MTNKQTGLENVNVDGDADINISQFVINFLDRLNDLQLEKFTHDQCFYNNLDDREFYGESIFVGREADLEQLHGLLQAQSQQVKDLPMVLIAGMAGIGNRFIISFRYRILTVIVSIFG